MARKGLLHSFFLILAAGILISFSEAEEKKQKIILNNGAKLNVPVVKETDEKLFVDLADTVIGIMKKNIISNVPLDGKDTAASKKSTRTDSFYASGNLPAASIKKLTEKFSSGVVMVQTPIGTGSGFIVNDNGFLLTNFHVIEKQTRIKIKIFHTKDNDKGFVEKIYKDVSIIAINQALDIALLKINNAEKEVLSPLFLGNITDVKTGDPVFAIGNPFGLKRSVSQGIISTTNRHFRGYLYIQTTAPINPGNSGGPLLNMRGEVVGITNMSALFSDGLGFAIPVNMVKLFLDNREAFAYDKDNPSSGYRYITPPTKEEYSTLNPEKK